MSTVPPLTQAAPPLAFALAGGSDPGREREENEDAFGLFAKSRLVVVADGMGGRAGGGMAARIAVDEVERFFREQHASPRSPWPFPIDKGLSLGSNLLRVGMQVANQKIREAAVSRPDLHRMGATVAALAVGETQVVVAHVGDVRVYRLRGGALAPLTRDHSVLEEVRAARPGITDQELAAIGHRHVVTRALGSRPEVEPAVSTHELERGDLYLLCSDGLWGTVGDPALASLLGGAADLDLYVQRLIAAANGAGGPDNITAVVVRIS
jgi:serine/threonine protein phosphatase PrpC